MNRLLQINTSLFAEQGQSSQLSQAMVEAWKRSHPAGMVEVLDLAQHPVPHLTAERFQAFITAPEKRTPAQVELTALSDDLIAQLKAADTVVLGLPMYNFGVPSTLKAYFDHIARAGVTFRYTANGPVGLLSGKRVYVSAARGGHYLGTPLDTQTQYVKDFFKFLGIDQIEFIYAEGLAIGPDKRKASLARAFSEIDSLAA